MCSEDGIGPVWQTADDNLQALSHLSGVWIDRGHDRRLPACSPTQQISSSVLGVGKRLSGKSVALASTRLNGQHSVPFEVSIRHARNYGRFEIQAILSKQLSRIDMQGSSEPSNDGNAGVPCPSSNDLRRTAV